MFKNLKTLSGHLPLGTPSPIPQRFHRVLLSLFLKELFQIFDKGLVHKFLKNFLVNFNWVKLFVNKGIFCRRQFPQDVSCEVTLVTHLYIPKKSSKITFEISLRLFHFFFLRIYSIFASLLIVGLLVDFCRKSPRGTFTDSPGIPQISYEWILFFATLVS